VICFTDDRQGIREEVKCFGLPELGCEIPPEIPGKWPKQALWAKDLFGLKGVALFLDLDVVITGNLDDFFSYGNPDDVILARTWVRPLERLGQSSVFRFPIGKHHYLLDNLRKDPVGISTRYRFEQRYVTKCVEGGIKFWPRGWVQHFRRDCMGPWPIRYLRPAKLTQDTRVVLFPSKPDPPDAIIGRWSEKYKPMPRWQYIKQAFSKDSPSKSWYSHLKSYVMPCDWVAQHWRE
jgi:hypothetical protein